MRRHVPRTAATSSNSCCCWTGKQPHLLSQPHVRLAGWTSTFVTTCVPVLDIRPAGQPWCSSPEVVALETKAAQSTCLQHRHIKHRLNVAGDMFTLIVSTVSLVRIGKNKLEWGLFCLFAWVARCDNYYTNLYQWLELQTLSRQHVQK